MNNDSVITVVLSRFILALAMVDPSAPTASQESQGILTTQWTEYTAAVPSLLSLDEELDGRGFNRDEAGSFLGV